MSDQGYLRALETRLGWLRWMNSSQGYRALTVSIEDADEDTMAKLEACRLGLENSGATYYMATPFCTMVNQLRLTIPDDLPLEQTWMLSQEGFVLFADQFEDGITPEMADEVISRGGFCLDRVDAIGWGQVKGVPVFVAYADVSKCKSLDLNPGAYGFLPVSVYGIPFGTQIGRVIGERNQELRLRYPKALAREDANEMLANKHSCLHLTYTMLYLMAQKLATTVRMPLNRHARKRIEQQTPPFDPLVKIITLRRLEQQAQKHEPHPVEWSCQWLVRWHWRNQYCPSTGEHKWIPIDTYVKGPSDKPLKSPGAKIFVANR